jgi:hypothetical protein
VILNTTAISDSFCRGASMITDCSERDHFSFSALPSVPHIYHIDSGAHDGPDWRQAFYYFTQHIFKESPRS